MTTFNIAYGPFEAPTGTVVSSTKVTVTNPDGTSTDVPVTLGAASFDYTFQTGNSQISVQGLDASGTVVGPAATGSFSARAPTTVTVQIPVAVSVAA